MLVLHLARFLDLIFREIQILLNGFQSKQVELMQNIAVDATSKLFPVLWPRFTKRYCGNAHHEQEGSGTFHSCTCFVVNPLESDTNYTSRKWFAYWNPTTARVMERMRRGEKTNAGWFLPNQPAHASSFIDEDRDPVPIVRDPANRAHHVHDLGVWRRPSTDDRANHDAAAGQSRVEAVDDRDAHGHVDTNPGSRDADGYIRAGVEGSGVLLVHNHPGDEPSREDAGAEHGDPSGALYPIRDREPAQIGENHESNEAQAAYAMARAGRRCESFPADPALCVLIPGEGRWNAERHARRDPQHGLVRVAEDHSLPLAA